MGRSKLKDVSELPIGSAATATAVAPVSAAHTATAVIPFLLNMIAPSLTGMMKMPFGSQFRLAQIECQLPANERNTEKSFEKTSIAVLAPE
jgi:hypothetical protein